MCPDVRIRVDKDAREHLRSSHHVARMTRWTSDHRVARAPTPCWRAWRRSRRAQAQSDTGTELLAKSPVRAGQFDGPVVINGNLTVNGTLNGHAASAGISTASASTLPHADGSQRLTLALQTPEQAAEDFGEATLTQGKATVKLDNEFARLLQGGRYQVFLTPDGDWNGLYVTNKSAGSFEVRELKAGTSGVGFSYRILAKLPKQTGSRLERVTSTPAGIQQDDKAPKPVQPIPVPDVVKPEGSKPRGGSER